MEQSTFIGYKLPVDNLDELVDGVLVHGDNFQGLSLLQERYKEQIDGVYIDPPYNTNASEIVYKNGYKRSSWNTLIYDRLNLSKKFLTKEGIACATIDDFAVMDLHKIYSDVYSEYELRVVIIEYNHRGRVKSNFATTHEYALWVIPDNKDLITRLDEYADEIKRNLRRTGNNSMRSDSPSMFYGIEVNKKSLEIVSVTDAIPAGASFIESNNPDTIMVYPVDSQGNERNWYFGKNRVMSEVREGGVWAKIINNEIQIHFRLDGKQKRRKTIWNGTTMDASTHGSELLNALFKLSEFDFPKSIYAVKDCLSAMTKHKKALFMDYFGGSGTTAHAVINLNRQDNGQRKYILMEQGEYFDTVLKPRIQKVVFSENWKEGKAQANNTGNFNGISHAFKVLKIESYEDTLNNLQLTRSKGQTDLLNQMQPQERSQYLMHYMLKLESKGSLLSVTDFLKPFGYQLNITTDSAGAYQTRTVDLVETFNYLLGLRVKQIDMQLDKGFVQVIGTLPNGESALIFWRDCDKINYEQLNKLLDKLHINPRDAEYDVIYVNGDHNIPTVFQSTIDEGGITRTQKIRQIEREFLDRMFAGA